MESGAQPESQENAPLMAAYAGDMDFTIPFINALGSVRYANSNGDTFLHAAAEGWQYRMMEFLIISGADVNAQNQQGETPLQSLARCREIPSQAMFLTDTNPLDARIRSFRTLIERKADRGIRSSRGGTALHLAAWEGDLLAVKELAVGLPSEQLEALTNQGATALTLAALNSHVDCARHLLQCGAEIGFQLPTGRRLIDAMQSSEIPEMRMLADEFPVTRKSRDRPT